MTSEPNGKMTSLGKLRNMENGLLRQINQSTKTETKPETDNGRNAHVLLCSGASFSKAEAYAKHLNINTIKCVDKDIFSRRDILPMADKTMYMLVDSTLCDIIMNQRRLHDCVYDFFEEFAASSRVCLIKNVPKDQEWRYLGLKCQIPQECIREVIEIEVNTENDDKRTMSNPNTDSNQAKYQLQRGNPAGNKAEDSCSRNEGASLEGDSQLNSVISEGGHHVQIGYKCVMNIDKPLNQKIVVRQHGSDSYVNVKIVPQPSVSKVIVVITTDPNNPAVENLLHHEIDEKLQVINLKLKAHDAFIVDKRVGSIIIEIKAEPGQEIEKEWIKNVIETIFIDEVQSHINPSVHLKLNIDSTFTIPLEEIGNFLTGKDLHKNCVSKDKYDAKEHEMGKLRKELTYFKDAYRECTSKDKKSLAETFPELNRVVKHETEVLKLKLELNRMERHLNASEEQRKANAKTVEECEKKQEQRRTDWWPEGMYPRGVLGRLRERFNEERPPTQMRPSQLWSESGYYEPGAFGLQSGMETHRLYQSSNSLPEWKPELPGAFGLQSGMETHRVYQSSNSLPEWKPELPPRQRVNCQPGVSPKEEHKTVCRLDRSIGRNDYSFPSDCHN